MLTPKHQYELRNSGIAPDIAALNFQSLEGPVIHEYLNYSEKTERTNTGRLASKYLNRHANSEAGGWYCNGVDPQNHWQEMLFGCFKPDHPREDYQKPGKIIKYEHPALVETRTFFLRVSLSIWKKIAKRYNLVLPENIVVNSSGEALGFWAWVLNNPKVPITICEGAKKAACLLSSGCVAIALPGIYGGYRSKDAQGKKIAPHLIPDLKAIAQKKRPIYICFDHDLKEQTIRNVNIATSQLGRLFKASGCDVKIVSLPGPEKGVDDFIVAQGVDAFWQIYNSALPLFARQNSLFKQLSYEPNVVVSTKYLGNIDIPGDTKLVVLKAPKGSGKTEAIALLCEQAYKNGQSVIVLTYREQLGRELGRRFKLSYKTELKESPEGKLFGYVLCVDSCHPHSEVGFIGDSHADALVIIDECESVIWHALNSATCTKNRLSILYELTALLTGVLSSNSLGRVVLADADTSDLTVDCIKGLAGQKDLQPYVILGDYKSEVGTSVLSYPTPVDLYASLSRGINRGGKHIIFTGGQRVTSKWGTQNLEKILSEQFPGARILRIDKETTADLSHPAFGCIDNLNAVLPQWDIVIASPAIESGVSIDLHNHFDGVWGFFPGVVPTNNVRQTLARVRDTDVPRHIYISERGLPFSFIGNGATSPVALRDGELKKFESNSNFLLNAGVTVDVDGSVNTNPTALETYLKMASRVNTGFHNYRETILADLEAEGCKVSRLESQLDLETKEELSESITESRDELTEEEAERVVEADPPQSEIEYKKLKSQKTKTPEERRSQVNYEIKQRYLTKPTVDITLKDWDGWYPHLQLHYYLTVGNQYLSDRDEKRFRGIALEGRTWVPDNNRVLLSNKVKALKALGIDKLFVPGVDWTFDSPEIQQIATTALACARDIKLYLGVLIGSKNSSMVIVQKILHQTMGFKLKRPPKGESQFIEKGIDSEGKRQRVRIYNFVPPSDRGEVFDRWLLRDAEATKQKTVTSSEQMDHQTPIDILKGLNDPSLGDPSTRKLRTPQLAQDVTATKVERVKMAIKGAVQQLKDGGAKITQAAIAHIVGVSQGYISRFKKLLLFLLEDSYSKSNNFPDPPPDVGEVQWMGQEYLPILAESPPNELPLEVLSVFESYGSNVWRQVWNATPATAQIKILQALMFTLAPGELRSIIATGGIC